MRAVPPRLPDTGGRAAQHLARRVFGEPGPGPAVGTTKRQLSAETELRPRTSPRASPQPPARHTLRATVPTDAQTV